MVLVTGDHNLDRAISNLSRVFRNYRGSAGWADGMSLSDSSVTLKKRVWDLAVDEYEDYCWHSVAAADSSTHGQALRYFLPRVAVDFSETGYARWRHSQLAYLLNQQDWETWKKAEADAIESWLYAWIEYAVRKSDWLQCLLATNCAAICGLDMNRFFHEFRERDQHLSIIWLARCVEDHWESLLTAGWPLWWQDYWCEETPPNERAVRFIDLMLRESSIGILEHAFFNEQEGQTRTLFSVAHLHATDCIRFNRAEPATPFATALTNRHLTTR